MIQDSAFRRFAEFGCLSPAENAAVRALTGPPQQLARHQIVRNEGDPANCFYLLLDGWMAAAITLQDGARQILKLHLPGDAIGTPSMAVERASETLFALTTATIAPVSFERFGRLLDEHPRVGARFLLSCQWERIALMDRLASIGRTAAGSRIVSFLLDLRERLAPISDADRDALRMYLTQEQIADLLSLTSVHVNRTIREMETTGLIRRDGQLWRLLDVPRLERLAKRPARMLRTDLAWLPPSR